jgi:hypothetical protein
LERKHVQFASENDSLLFDARNKLQQLREALAALGIEQKLMDLISETQNFLVKFAIENEVHCRVMQFREGIWREKLGFIGEVAAKLKLEVLPCDEDAVLKAVASLSGMRQFLDLDGSIREEPGLSLLSPFKGECDADLPWRRFSRIRVSECSSALGSIRFLYCERPDGSYSLTFHRKCAHFGSTLTLIETSLHPFFGHYTPCLWNSTFVNVFDDGCRSFIFTLTKPVVLGRVNSHWRRAKGRSPAFPGMVQHSGSGVIFEECNSHTKK